MDTSTYFYAGYMIFWLLPAVYLIRIARKLTSLEGQVDRALQTLKP